MTSHLFAFHKLHTPLLAASVLFAMLSNTTVFAQDNTKPSLSQIDQAFNNPPNEFRLVHYKMGRTPKDIDFNELASHGIGGIQTMVPTENYLQDEEGWELTKSNIEQAKERGLQVWIHDERGYPSGAAGGLVVQGHPEYEVRGLIRITRSGKGEEPLTPNSPTGIKFICATIYEMAEGEIVFSTAKEIFLSGNSVQTQGLDGDWQLSVFGEKILDKNTQAQSTVKQFGQTGHYPSLLNKDACARFVQLTHQAYADKLGNIDKKVDVFYTGEANLMASFWPHNNTTRPAAEHPYIPWEKSIINAFQTMHGYDIMPNLDALFSGNSDKAKTVRLHYYQTVAELVAENYGGQITAWCDKNGVLSMGHPLLEEDIICHVFCYGDMIRFLREFHIKGCDLHIGREENKYWIFWMGKYISSAAYLDNQDAPTIMGLLDPIIGGYGQNDLTPDIPILRRTVNMNMLCGLNQFTSYMPYQRKVDGYQADAYKRFNDYVGRICMMLRGAQSEAPIAMYYPIKTLQSKYLATDKPWTDTARQFKVYQDVVDNLARDILENGLDFNYVTDDVLLESTVRNTKLIIGTHVYSQLVMPKVEVIPLNVLKRIQDIKAAGIPVHWVEGLPQMGAAMDEHDNVRAIAKTLQTSNAPIPDLKAIKTDEFSIDIQTSNGPLSMARFRKEDKRIYFIINNSNDRITLTATSEDTKSLKVYNPVDGNIKEVALPLSEEVGGYESLLLVEDCESEVKGHERQNKRMEQQ